MAKLWEMNRTEGVEELSDEALGDVAGGVAAIGTCSQCGKKVYLSEMKNGLCSRCQTATKCPKCGRETLKVSIVDGMCPICRRLAGG